VGGGNTGYLSYWLQQSGFADKLPDLLRDTVYVGVSAGSAMVTHGVNVDRDRLERTGIYYDDEYDEAAPQGAGSNWTLGLVDSRSARTSTPTTSPWPRWSSWSGLRRSWTSRWYAFDDETALKVVDGEVEVVSEGQWRLFDATTRR
jgi:dipeptidase E